MLKAFRATVLILTLSFSVFAGEMPNGVQPTPTPLMDTHQTEELTVNEVGYPQESPITTTEIITLNLVQIVLALF